MPSAGCRSHFQNSYSGGSCCCRRGPAGATGNTGPQGETGPQGATGDMTINCALQMSRVDLTCGGQFPCPSEPTGVTRFVNPGDSIQDVINASSSGDQIIILPGVYPQQITIPAGLDNLFIRPQVPGTVTIQSPPGGLVGSGAIISIDGALCTNIQDLTIAGPDTTGTLLRGIEVINGGSAFIAGNRLLDIRSEPLSGAQNIAAINVETGSAALIINNEIFRYQKTGIRVNGAGTCAGVYNNNIIGVGPTSILAQNGIQISRGATAQVQNNFISNNIYSPGTTFSTGILLFEIDTSNPVTLENNVSENNDVGIALANTLGALVQINVLSNNLHIGNYVLSDSAQNTFIQNAAFGNPDFDYVDESVGVLSAYTANVYLCNRGVTDNKNGAIIASMSPYPAFPINGTQMTQLFLTNGPSPYPPLSPQ